MRIPNYRKFFVGQLISRIGTWLQRFAQSWLVYDITGNATMVGVAVALQAVPTMVVGPYAGLIADRLDKRRMMISLQAMMAVLTLILGILTVTGAIRLWEVLLLALLLGLNEAFEIPARQVFVFELVGEAQLANAVGLNSVLSNVARATGPAVGAGLAALLGVGWCFLANSTSFVATIVSLLMVDRLTLHAAPRARRARGQLHEGLSYVRSTPSLWIPIAMMAMVGMFTWEFQTVLPAMTSQTLHGSATAYGLILAAQGGGSVLGGLAVAATRQTGPGRYVFQAIAFGITMALASAAPNLSTEIALMALVGFTATSFMATGNTLVQLNTERSMRGRIMSLWVVASQGMTPVGGPLAGFVTHTAGARAAMGMGAAACFGAAGLGALMRARPPRSAAVPATTPSELLNSANVDEYAAMPTAAEEQTP